MILNPADLREGSILFIRGNTIKSWLIRKFLNFDYSHVAVNIGCGVLVESDVWGVQATSINNYLNSDIWTIEVVNPPFLADNYLTNVFTGSLLEHLKEQYDYHLAMGYLLTKWLRVEYMLWNTPNMWICSELVAHGVKKAGYLSDYEESAVTPKILYTYLKEFRHEGEVTQGKT